MAHVFPCPPLSLCRLATGVALVLLTAAAAVPASAQGLDEFPEVRAIQASTPIVLDGRPDEAAWDAAPVFNRFIQQVPQSGADATVRTEVRIVFDDEALYVGVRAHQPPGVPIIANELRRDAGRMHERNDTFTIALDTFWIGVTATSST